MSAIFALLLVTVGAQTPAHSGVVVDLAGRPIAGATVIVSGASGSARTGIDGAFTLSSLPSAPIVVIVILPDGRVARPIRLEHIDRLREIRLDADAGWHETLTVHGVAPDIAVSVGASNAVETFAGLTLRQPMTLPQAIENVPGVSWISEGQGAAPAIRGLARGRTLVLLDGARVSTERGAGANASFLDPVWLARVDVSRGPGSVAYGTDAFGGVIAARTIPPDVATPFAVQVAASLGDGLPVRRGALDITHGYRRGGIVAGIRMREFDDYHSPDGVVPHSGWEDSGARVQWAHAIGGGRVSAGWQRDDARDIGRPRSDSSTIVATSPFERSQRFTVGFERAVLGAWRDLRIDAFAGTSRERIEQDRLAAPGRPRRVDRTDSEAHDLQIRATAARSIGGLRLNSGIDVLRRHGVTSTDTAFQYNAGGALASTTITESLESAQRTAVGLFVDAETAVQPWLRLAGGLRGETIHGGNRGGFFGDRTIDDQAVAASGAVTLASRHGLSVTAQAARGFRDPTLTDRFSRGPIGRGFLEGNPGLLPETSRQFDVTVRYSRGRVDLHGASYRYEIRNLVERFTAAPDLFRIRNRGRARLTGAELAANVGVGGGVALEVIAQASRGRDADEGTPLNDVAPRSLALIARHAWRTRLSSYVKVSAVAAHDAAGPGEVPTPGYTLIDAAAGWRLGRGVDLRVTVRNALDASYYSSAGPRWVLAAGRQAIVTLVVAAGTAPSKP